MLVNPWHYCAPLKFQSTPDREAGRCVIEGEGTAVPARRFNPRPTVRPGDADAAMGRRCHMVVSIHARP